MKPLFRVIPTSDWHRARETGRVPRCGADQRSGFVHLATEHTALTTANLYFDPDEAPLALELDPEALGAQLEWDVPSDAHGPHLYGEGIPCSAVRACWVLTSASDGTFRWGTRQATELPSSGATVSPKS
jgi:uncharacterized protein (DUF952 family)